MAPVSPFDEDQWEFLFAVAARVAPPVTEFDPERRARFRAIISEALALRPPAVVGQIGMFLGVLDRAPALRYGRTFRALDPARQDAVLRWFQEAPLQKLRQGLWGVKTLVYMGTYAQTEIAPRLHYAPSFDGNVHLHA